MRTSSMAFYLHPSAVDPSPKAHAELSKFLANPTSTNAIDHEKKIIQKSELDFMRQ
jgi:hypothetical protein